MSRAGLAWEGEKTMAVPARESAAAQDPAHSRRKSDPMSPGWVNVQDGLIIGVEAWRLAVVELVAAVRQLAANPDAEAVKAAKAALAMVRLTGGVVENLGEMGRRWVVDEAVLEAERARAYAEGYAACKAERCRLQVVDGG